MNQPTHVKSTLPTRRQWALGTVAGLTAAALPHHANAQTGSAVEAKPNRRANPIAVSTYSYWRYRDDSKLSTMIASPRSSVMLITEDISRWSLKARSRTKRRSPKV